MSLDFWKALLERDNPPGEAHGWIQWKGTDACIDLHCKCGHLGHLDREFLYFYKCKACGAKYAVGQNVKLIPLDDEEARLVEDAEGGFHTEDE